MQPQERNVCALLMKLLMSWYNVLFLTCEHCRFVQVLIFLFFLFSIGKLVILQNFRFKFCVMFGLQKENEKQSENLYYNFFGWIFCNSFFCTINGGWLFAGNDEDRVHNSVHVLYFSLFAYMYAYLGLSV